MTSEQLRLHYEECIENEEYDNMRLQPPCYLQVDKEEYDSGLYDTPYVEHVIPGEPRIEEVDWDLDNYYIALNRDIHGARKRPSDMEDYAIELIKWCNEFGWDKLYSYENVFPPIVKEEL